MQKNKDRDVFMKIKKVKISEIKPYEHNPRVNDDAVDAVANSIKKFGWQQPIVVDKNSVIIAGHTRYKAAKRLKMNNVPVVYAENLTDEQVKAYRLADNKSGEIATWDDTLLSEELDSILNIDMSAFGFDDLDKFLDEQEAEDDDFDEELPEKPKSKLGQIYQLGRHRLMCGDSTDKSTVNKLMGGKTADLLLTDPPYNVNYSEKHINKRDSLERKYSSISNDNLSSSDFLEFLTKAFTCAKESLKAGAAFYIWFAGTESINFYTAVKNAGLGVHQQLIWVKNNIVLSRQDYQNKHEPCLYGWVEGGAHTWYSDRKQTTILNFDKPLRSDLHPTMKPIPLFDYLIKNSSKSGDIVLDLFGGSGTTIMACEQNGRNAYMMEYDPRYIDVIIDRWEKYTGEKAKLIEE